ncbi:MAG: glycerol-3-phosphate 1-O-acyltransferase PlsY [Micavibrio sp.]
MDYAYLAAAIGGYLVGSVPFGLILTRLGGYGDIRAIGSGNIGATNVLRTGNRKLALATLFLDAAKGALAVSLAFIIARIFFTDCSTMVFQEGAAPDNCAAPEFFYRLMLLSGFFALLGHLFPFWLRFKGGKGVATALGILLALKPLVGIAACGLWLLTALVTRYSSLSALVAIGAAPAIAHSLYHDANLTGLCGAIATLVFIKHRANVKRLLGRQEPKIGQKS